MKQAAGTVFALAYDRKDFKKYVTEKIRGAIIHFYMFHLARDNGLVKWTKHWETEVNRLLMELWGEVISPIKGRWGRRKAVSEVIAEMRGVDHLMRNWAAGRVKSHYKLRRIRKDLPPELTDEFYSRVGDEVEMALASGYGDEL